MSMIDDTVTSSLDFLAQKQKNDGSFPSFTSFDPNGFANAVMCPSVFSTALILSCLNSIDCRNDATLDTIKKNAADFLLAQKSKHWSFNYWARESAQANKMPYPDDLDDTACALAALHECDPGLIDGEVLANVVSVLTTLEVKEGGPYRTWLVPPDAHKVWLDVDLAVNSNVAYFLSLQDVQLENIIALVESAIDAGDYASPYYPSPYPVTYFISRFYRGAKSNEVVNFLLNKREGDAWGTPLNTALAILTLLNLGLPREELRGSIEYLRQHQNGDGSWDAGVFYAGINPKQREGDTDNYYAGSAALTTAFCVAAISASSCAGAPEHTQDLKRKNDQEEVYKRVVQRARETFSALGADLKKQALMMLEKTIERDKDKHIVLLPYFFLRALGQTLNPKQKSLLIDLGLANLYGWMAYTIYDDFLDEEGDPQMLSVANIALREADRIFLQVIPDSGFSDFSRSVLNRIDGANAWEVAHCRTKERTVASALVHPILDFSDVAHLADRSLGHALGPVGVLCILGYKTSSPECTAVLEGLRHYIAAKQLHDDMHDWEEDLSRGQINAASAELFNIINGHKFQKNEMDIQFLRRVFWEEAATVLCDRAFAHLDQARDLMLSVGVSQVFVDGLLDPLRSVTEQTLKERCEAEKFIVAYAQDFHG